MAGAEALLGLRGSRVLERSETPAEVSVITIETAADFMGYSPCGIRAVSLAHAGGDLRYRAPVGHPPHFIEKHPQTWVVLLGVISSRRREKLFAVSSSL